MIIGRSSILGGSGGAAGYAGKIKALQPLGYWRMHAGDPTTEPDASGNGFNATYANTQYCHTRQAGPLVNEPSYAVRFEADTYGPGDGAGDCVAVYDRRFIFAYTETGTLILWIKPNGFFINRVAWTRETWLEWWLGDQVILKQGWNGQWNTGLSTPVGQWSMVTAIWTPGGCTCRVNKTEATGPACTGIEGYFDNPFNIAGHGKFDGTISEVAVFPGKTISKADTDALFDAATIAK
jgi:hypothetical protein